MVLESGIILSQFIWLWRVRHVRREAKKVGMTYDEYVAAHPSKKLVRTDSSETIIDVEAGHVDCPHFLEKCASESSTTESLANHPMGTNTNSATTKTTLAVPEKAVTVDSGRS